MSRPLQWLDGMPLNRRDFAALSVGAALGLNASTAATSQTEPTAKPLPTLHIRPRYHRWHVDPGVEWLEANTDYAHLDWTAPLHQAALVLVDVWDRHYLQDAAARAETIIHERFVPLLAGCRQAGLTIIHAPSPPQAIPHPSWVGNGRESPTSTPASDWPPPEFRNKSGQFAAYARPAEPREPELSQLRSRIQVHPQVGPVGNEPVIATGDELHDFCRTNGILILIFAGFNTNACILMRDYGTLAMSQRGYEVILLRDCTTGMESRASLPTLGQTNAAILLLEMFGQYSLTSDELLAGLAPP